MESHFQNGHLIVLLKTISLWVFAFLNLALTCCVMIPIPHEEKIHAGTKIEVSQLEDFVLGVTTRTEVERKLGPPAIFWTDKQITYYRWDGSTWGLLMIGLYYGGGYGDRRVCNLLLFQYDQDNILIRFEVRRVKKTQAGEFLQKWASEGNKP